MASDQAVREHSMASFDRKAAPEGESENFKLVDGVEKSAVSEPPLAVCEPLGIGSSPSGHGRSRPEGQSVPESKTGARTEDETDLSDSEDETDLSDSEDNGRPSARTTCTLTSEECERLEKTQHHLYGDDCPPLPRDEVCLTTETREASEGRLQELCQMYSGSSSEHIGELARGCQELMATNVAKSKEILQLNYKIYQLEGGCFKDRVLRQMLIDETQGEFSFSNYCGQSETRMCRVCYQEEDTNKCSRCPLPREEHQSETGCKFLERKIAASHAISETVLKTACRGNNPVVWDASACKQLTPTACKWLQLCRNCDSSTGKIEKEFNTELESVMDDPSKYYLDREDTQLTLKQDHADLFHIYTFRALPHNSNIHHYNPLKKTTCSTCSKELCIRIAAFLKRAHHLSRPDIWREEGSQIPIARPPNAYMDPSDAGMLFHLEQNSTFSQEYIEFPIIVKVYFDPSAHTDCESSSADGNSTSQSDIPESIRAPIASGLLDPEAGEDKPALYSIESNVIHFKGYSGPIAPFALVELPDHMIPSQPSSDVTPSQGHVICTLMYTQIPPFAWAFLLVEPGDEMKGTFEKSTRTAQQFVESYHPQAREEAKRLQQYFPSIIKAVNKRLAEERKKLFVKGSSAQKWHDRLRQKREEMEQKRLVLHEKQQKNDEKNISFSTRRDEIETKKASLRDERKTLREKEIELEEEKKHCCSKARIHELQQRLKTYSADHESCLRKYDELCMDEVKLNEEERAYLTEAKDIIDELNGLHAAAFVPKLIIAHPSCCVEVDCPLDAI